jgi:hypothetical protein
LELPRSRCLWFRRQQPLLGLYYYGPCQAFASGLRDDRAAPKAIVVRSAALPGTGNLVLLGERVISPLLLEPIDAVIDTPAAIAAIRGRAPLTPPHLGARSECRSSPPGARRMGETRRLRLHRAVAPGRRARALVDGHQSGPRLSGIADSSMRATPARCRTPSSQRLQRTLVSWCRPLRHRP